MEEKEFLKLQNGSDIRGIALEGIAGETVNLTGNTALRVAKAFAIYLSRKLEKSCQDISVGIGHDSRLSANGLKEGVIKGLAVKGCRIFDCGLASTPSMFMSTVLEECGYDGAVMITASHLPFNRNGFKLFTKDGGLEKEEIRQILHIAAEESDFGKNLTQLRIPSVNLLGVYSKYLKERIYTILGNDEKKPLEGLHIVVDASNGVSGYFANMLTDLGADIEGSICLEPDGTFPNHVPNPENAQAMAMLREATLAAKADLGVIFDTDGDRAAVVFSDGEEVNKNAIIALMASILSKEFPGTTVVTDSVTSNYLTEFLEKELSMKHHRYKRGYKNVINEAIRLNIEGTETHLAIETSGHGALKENYFLDDGAYMCVRIISELARCRQEGRKLEDLIRGLKKAEESKEIRIQILQEDFASYGKKVVEEFTEYMKEQPEFQPVGENYEGIRMNYGDKETEGWVLLRLSLHDPLLVLNMEADKEHGIQHILDKITPFFKQYEQLGDF